MPLYEYSCGDCATGFEELVMGTAEVACPRCGSARVERLLSVFAAPTSQGSSADLPALPAGCGRCGDPRGPGACSS